MSLPPAWQDPNNPWQFLVHRVGTEWWASWFTPNCGNPLQGFFRFQFNNPNQSLWDIWTTTTNGTNDPYNSIIDQASNHMTEPDGGGYRVHVPWGEPTPAIPSTWGTVKAVYR